MRSFYIYPQSLCATEVSKAERPNFEVKPVFLELSLMCSN